RRTTAASTRTRGARVDPRAGCRAAPRSRTRALASGPVALGPRRPQSLEPLEQEVACAGDRDPLLRERVTVSDRDLCVLERLVVDRKRPRGADLVLPAVPLPAPPSVSVLG